MYGLLPRALAHPVGWPFSSGRLPRGTPRHPGFRHARLTVSAAGLERRTIDEPERLPSDRPGPCGSSGLGHACCSRAWRRPAPCRLPRARPAPSRAGGPLQAIPSLPAFTPVMMGETPYPRPSRTLRERCVSPTSATDFTSRAPRGLLDSWLRLSARDASRRVNTSLRARSNTPARPGPWTRRRRGRVPRRRLPDEPTRWSFA